MQRLPQLNTQGPNLVGMFDAGNRMRLADLAENRAVAGEERAKTLHDIAKAGEERAVSGEARKVEKHEQDMAKVQAERMVKGVQRGLKLLQNVKTPEQYQRAMSMYGKTYPELAEQLPVDYDPEALGQQLEWGRSFTELNDKTSPTGKLVADLDKLKPDDPKREIYEKMIAKGMSHGDINYKPDGKGGYVREAAAPDKADIRQSRLHNDIARNLFKISDMASIDEQTASRILSTTVKTEQYMAEGMTRATAMETAYKEQKVTEESFKKIPAANTGRWNNKPETVKAISPIMEQGIPFSQILKALVEKGWEEKEAREIMGSAIQR